MAEREQGAGSREQGAVYVVDIEGVGPVGDTGPFFKGETVEAGWLPPEVLSFHTESGALRPANEEEARKHRAGETVYTAHITTKDGKPVGSTGAAAIKKYGLKAAPTPGAAHQIVPSPGQRVIPSPNQSA